MKLLYFVPILAVLGLSLSVHADSEGDTLQAWIDYVEEYRQYMEEYRQWAADRFEYYQIQISELADQLDEKDARIQELEGSINSNDNTDNQRLQDQLDEKDARIQELESSMDAKDDTNNQNHTTANPQQEKTTEYRELNLIQTKGGVSVGLHEIDFATDHTRTYITIENLSDHDVNFSFADSYIKQGNRQYNIEPYLRYDISDRLDPFTPIRPGIIESGNIIFEPIDTEDRNEWVEIILVVWSITDYAFAEHRFVFPE